MASRANFSYHLKQNGKIVTPQGENMSEKQERLSTLREQILENLENLKKPNNKPPHVTFAEAVASIHTDILLEMQQQAEEHDDDKKNSYQWMSLLTEEVGEVAQAINQKDAPGYIIELLQVGALIYQMICMTINITDREDTE